MLQALRLDRRLPLVGPWPERLQSLEVV